MNHGMVMRAWYDIDFGRRVEDSKGVLEVRKRGREGRRWGEREEREERGSERKERKLGRRGLLSLTLCCFL